MPYSSLFSFRIKATGGTTTGCVGRSYRHHSDREQDEFYVRNGETMRVSTPSFIRSSPKILRRCTTRRNVKASCLIKVMRSKVRISSEWHDNDLACAVITQLEGFENVKDLAFKTRDERIALLQTVLLASETQADIARDADGGFDVPHGPIGSNVSQGFSYRLRNTHDFLAGIGSRTCTSDDRVTSGTCGRATYQLHRAPKSG